MPWNAYGILKAVMRVAISSIQSICNSRHKARSSKATSFSIMCTIQEKYLREQGIKTAQNTT